MLDRLIAAADILWIPCGVLALMFSFGPTISFVFSGEENKEGKLFIWGMIVPMVWSILSLVFFIGFMALGFMIYGGFAVVKSLWNAA